MFFSISLRFDGSIFGKVWRNYNIGSKNMRDEHRTLAGIFLGISTGNYFDFFPDLIFQSDRATKEVIAAIFFVGAAIL